ncbi:MAG: ABC transporter ATP-binding protein [Thermodesulfobacteriota bacterium]
MLEINHVTVCHGKKEAVSDITLHVQKGSIVTLLGANGAGKTSLLQAVSGLNKITSGSIVFEQNDLTNQPAHHIVEKGIGHCPEGRHVFPEMTVKENLFMGAYLRTARKGLSRSLQMVYHYFPVLEKRSRQMAGTLSGGEQQMVAMGRALMSQPKLLILDEPSLGLAPRLVQEIAQIIKRLNREEKTTILLVEQNTLLALNIAEKGYVLETGRIVLENRCAELIGNDHVRRSYLGM